jgi:hypothetical protein
MELHGSTHLFNLSLLAITFAAVSVLVMLVRQTMGGKLSKVDVHLVTTFVSLGFVQAIIAVLPPTVDLLGLSGRALWATASGVSAVLLAAVWINIQWERAKFTMGRKSPVVVLRFALQWFAVMILAINAVIPTVQGVGLHSAAVMISLGTAMWAFVSRIASLGGDKPNEDWDLKHG